MPTMISTTPGIARANALDTATAAQLFGTMFASAQLGAAFASCLPFADEAAAFAALRQIHAQADTATLKAAIQAHPPIGRAPAAGSYSQAEQAAAQDDAKTLRHIQHLNEVYQHRFGYVFLIRAAGRSATEILEHLQRRLE